MKITENTRLYIGSNVEQSMESQAGKSVQTDKVRLFAGNIVTQNPLDAQIAEKRATAMEKAKKLIGDVFAAEKSVDDDLAERANRIKESEQAIVSANKELAKFTDQILSLCKKYGK